MPPVGVTSVVVAVPHLNRLQRLYLGEDLHVGLTVGELRQAQDRSVEVDARQSDLSAGQTAPFYDGCNGRWTVTHHRSQFCQSRFEITSRCVDSSPRVDLAVNLALLRLEPRSTSSGTEGTGYRVQSAVVIFTNRGG